MKHRTAGHTETTISGDTRADWSEAFELVPSIQIAYIWHASLFTREVLNGLLRIGFLYPQQLIWNKGRAVLTRTLYWFAHEPCWFVRKKNAPWYGKAREYTTIWGSPLRSSSWAARTGRSSTTPRKNLSISCGGQSLNHTKRGQPSALTKSDPVLRCRQEIGYRNRNGRRHDRARGPGSFGGGAATVKSL
jgi:hypothetical protein